jgi:hypothetical protein
MIAQSVIYNFLCPNVSAKLEPVQNIVRLLIYSVIKLSCDSHVRHVRILYLVRFSRSDETSQ